MTRRRRLREKDAIGRRRSKIRSVDGVLKMRSVEGVLEIRFSEGVPKRLEGVAGNGITKSEAFLPGDLDGDLDAPRVGEPGG